MRQWNDEERPAMLKAIRLKRANHALWAANMLLKEAERQTKDMPGVEEQHTQLLDVRHRCALIKESLNEFDVHVESM